MPETQKVTFYTVPSTYESKYSTSDILLDRVVGVQKGKKSVIWSAEDERAESHYERSSAVEQVVDMPKSMADKLGRYYSKYFVENPGDPNNCHRFGYWMSGSIVADEPQGVESPDFVTEGFPVKGNALSLGRPGVLGSLGAAEHSVVGLGDGKVIEVTGNGGFMAIEPIQGMLDRYNADERGLRIFGW